jgi:hypothetical protein
MEKWKALTEYLLIQRSEEVSIQITDLRKIVGKLSDGVTRRISYWDPIMGRKQLTPGAAAWKARFVVVGFDWDVDGQTPRIAAIKLCVYKKT